jgi:hypothetical protein
VKAFFGYDQNRVEMGAIIACFTDNITVAESAFATKRRSFPEFDFGKSIKHSQALCESGNAQPATIVLNTCELPRHAGSIGK